MDNTRDRPTMQDIADKLGVSKALVSLVFRKAPGPSEETRERVFAAAEELGYRVNRTAALMTARRFIFSARAIREWLQRFFEDSFHSLPRRVRFH